MSDYVYKNSYNLSIEAGYGSNTAFDSDTNLARCTAIAEWINGNLGDIFEATVTVESNYTCCYIYFKGTNSGLCTKTYASNSSSNLQHIGIAHNGTYVSKQTAVYLYASDVNLLVVKSKYGVIAGLYKENLSGMICTMGINKFDGTFTSLVFSGGTLYISDAANSEESTSLPYRGTSGQAVLSRFNVPTLDTIPDGIYMSTGASSANGGIFTVGGGTDMFCEADGGSGYAGCALKLEESEDGDYTEE